MQITLGDQICVFTISLSFVSFFARKAILRRNGYKWSFADYELKDWRRLYDLALSQSVARKKVGLLVLSFSAEVLFATTVLVAAFSRI